MHVYIPRTLSYNRSIDGLRQQSRRYIKLRESKSV